MHPKAISSQVLEYILLHISSFPFLMMKIKNISFSFLLALVLILLLKLILLLLIQIFVQFLISCQSVPQQFSHHQLFAFLSAKVFTKNCSLEGIFKHWKTPVNITGLCSNNLTLRSTSKVNSTKWERVLNVSKTYFLEHHSRDLDEVYMKHTNLLIFI